MGGQATRRRQHTQKRRITGLRSGPPQRARCAPAATPGCLLDLARRRRAFFVPSAAQPVPRFGGQSDSCRLAQPRCQQRDDTDLSPTTRCLAPRAQPPTPAWLTPSWPSRSRMATPRSPACGSTASLTRTTRCVPMPGHAGVSPQPARVDTSLRARFARRPRRWPGAAMPGGALQVFQGLLLLVSPLSLARCTCLLGAALPYNRQAAPRRASPCALECRSTVSSTRD